MSPFQTLEWNIAASEPCLPSSTLGKLGFNFQWFTSHKQQKVLTTLLRSANHSPLPQKLTSEASYFHPWVLIFLMRQLTTRGNGCGPECELTRKTTPDSCKTQTTQPTQHDSRDLVLTLSLPLIHCDLRRVTMPLRACFPIC